MGGSGGAWIAKALQVAAQIGGEDAGHPALREGRDPGHVRRQHDVGPGGAQPA